MLSMPEIDDIRTMDRKGATIAQISRATGHDPKTVRKYLDKDDFSPKPPKKQNRPSILDPFKPFIDEILIEDLKVWRKQRHSATRIFERLRDEMGYTGGITTVRVYVAKKKAELYEQRQDEGYLDLEWAPGSMQADFGDVDVSYQGSLRRMHQLTVGFPYSGAAFTQLFGGETAECVCQGLWNVFCYLGGIAPIVVIDNATGAARKSSAGKVTEAELFKLFRLHCRFELRVCNPYSGHEKGHVEREVDYTRSHLMVPVPKVADLVSFNAELLERSSALNASKLHWRQGVGVAELFEKDRQALLALPSKPFLARRWVEVKLDKWGEATLEGAHTYDISPALAKRRVIAELDAYRISFEDPEKGELICSYERDFGNGPTHAKDPLAQLFLLTKKPGAFRESALRNSLSEPLKTYLDTLKRDELRSQLSTIAKAAAQAGPRAALEAAGSLVEQGLPMVASDLCALARRIAQGEESEPIAGVDLSLYDRVLIGERGM